MSIYISADAENVREISLCYKNPPIQCHSPASNRIFQSLLLKFKLMWFQKMSAPWERERACRSRGTAREANWQNSDFSMDHRLKHRHK